MAKMTLKRLAPCNRCANPACLPVYTDKKGHRFPVLTYQSDCGKRWQPPQDKIPLWELALDHAQGLHDGLSNAGLSFMPKKRKGRRTRR